MRFSKIIFGLLCIAGVLTAVLVFRQKDTQPTLKPGAYVPEVSDRSGMPPVKLAEPDSPFMWYQQFKDQNGKITELRAGYRDNRLAYFIYNRSNSGLAEVRISHPGWDAPLAFEAKYNASGSAIASWKRYRADKTLEMTMERSDKCETHIVYDSRGLRQKRTDTLSDGSQSVIEYTDGGQTIANSYDVPATANEQVVVEWDVNGRKSPRVKLKLRGVRIDGWEYLNPEGEVEHTARFVDGGVIEFEHPAIKGQPAADGKPEIKEEPRRLQRYAPVAEDWQRTYYRLTSAEIFYPDGKTVNHRVLMHVNGMQKQHDRFDKDGKLEAIRNFSPQMIQLRTEEFDVKTGASKGVWASPPLPPSRGFVPDGIKNIPGWDEKLGPVYDFGGTPYMDQATAQRTNPLFIVK